MALLALFSDVHDNTAALERALTYLQSRGVGSYLQLGDLGLDPLPVLDGLPVQHVFGNWEVSGLVHMAEPWQSQVAAWPASLTGPSWIATHATPAFPAECLTTAATATYKATHQPRWVQLFPSLLHDEQAIWQALAALEQQNRLVAFHGHTHVQAVQHLEPGGRLRRLAVHLIDLAPDARTLVGVGSIGSPRDGPSPRCVLFDAANAQVELVTIP